MNSQIFSENVLMLSRRFNDINILRRTAAIVSIITVGVTNLSDMIMCSFMTNHLSVNHAGPINITTFEHLESTICKLYPSYFSNFAILILVATSVVVQLTHMCKFGLMLTIAGTKCNFFHFDSINMLIRFFFI